VPTGAAPGAFEGFPAARSSLAGLDSFAAQLPAVTPSCALITAQARKGIRLLLAGLGRSPASRSPKRLAQGQVVMAGNRGHPSEPR